jgi:hypothetical protein
MGKNMLQSGAVWLGQQLKAHAGRTVKIEQGAQVINNVLCSAGTFEHEITDEDGFSTKFLAFDWTFTAADLVANGAPITLRKGAIVTEVLNGVEAKYEALPLGTKPALELLDSSGILLVLHTKQIK